MPSKSSKQSITSENDRVMVFIDGSNLYHVLTQSCGRHDLQFDKFALKLANGRKLQRIYYYNIRQESDTNPNMGVEQGKFLESMYDTPYVEVRLGIWKQRGDIMVEKGVDVMLATDVVTNAYKDHYDTAIVVSGDADFYPALQAVKDVGKHVEVAAFDMNLSGESARVADVVQKFNKTWFTGLWMTRAQSRSRAAASSRPEVSDEAASPNGEDKQATKAATARRSGTRRTSAAATKTRRTAAPRSAAAPRTAAARTRRPAARRDSDAEAPVTDNRDETATDTGSDSTTRRAPTRRRVGASSTRPTNGAGNGRSAPKPPPLRKSSAAEEPSKVSSSDSNNDSSNDSKPAVDAEPVGSPTRRRNWRGRLGLNNNEDE